MFFSAEWWKKKWPKDGAWSIDWSDVLDSLKCSRAHLTCDGKMDTREEKKGCSLSGSWFWERCYPQLEGELWKNLLLLSLLMRVLLAKVLPQIAFLSFEYQSVYSRDTEPMVWFLLRNLATWLWISWRIRRVWRFSCSRPHVICWQNSLLAGVRSVFVLVRPLTDQMRPAYIMDGNLLLLKVPWFKC